MCNFYSQFEKYDHPKMGLVRLPSIVISAEQKRRVDLNDSATNFQFLKAVAREGFKNKNIPKEQWKAYGDRAKYELDIFEELGFTDYVLLVWLVIEKARSLGTFIDYGRGSCSGSLIFWFLNITGVDPIDKNLLFERFVSKTRSKKQIIDGNVYLQGDLIADADLNLGSDREKIVEWLKEIYPNRISKIATRSTLTGKALIKDVYKTIKEVSEEEAKRVSDMIERHYGIVEELDNVYENNADFKKWATDNKEVYEISLSLRNLIRQKSSHASGYVVSYYDFDGFLPVELNHDKEIMASFDMQDVSNYVVKLDLLGLTTNSIIKNVIDQTGVDLSKVNLDNEPIVYDQFQNEKLLPYGLYQISADCAFGVLNQIKPKNIFELSDVNAMARPGALAYVKSYIKNDQKSPHSIFDLILKPTRNHCLYQEQMMHMAVALGFTLDESEQLRKVVGKKQVEKVKEWKDKIYEKIKQKNYDVSLGDLFWKILDDSSKYSFNKSHSLSTSYLTALTVYLKYKYPLEFYWACLQNAKQLANPVKEISMILKETNQMGIKVFPPSVIKSDDDFKFEDGGIRFGLGYIKGIAAANLKKVSSFKRNFSNKLEVFEFASTLSIPINILETLFWAGAFSIDETSRLKLSMEARAYNLMSNTLKTKIAAFAADYNYDLIETIKSLKDKINEKGKPFLPKSQLDTFRNKFRPYWENYQKNIQYEKLFNYLAERIHLGFSYSNTLHNLFSERASNLIPIQIAASEPKNTSVSFVAFVDDFKKAVGRESKKPYVRYYLSDETASIRALLSGADKINSMEQFNNGLPEKDSIVVIHGKSAGDGMVFIDSMIMQPNPIKFKKSEFVSND